MEILMIGGTGVLSSAVVQEAVKRNIKVTIINRGKRKQNVHENVTTLISDKNDKKRIASLLHGKWFDAVMDFLCCSAKDTSDSFNFYSNYTKQYFFISSCAVYDTSLGQVCVEDSPKVLPVWKYSVNKWASEKTLVELAGQTDVNYTIVRPCVTYGDTRIPYGITPEYGYHWTLIARILKGKPLIRWHGGANRCNMMRVEDFAVGMVGLVGNPEAYNEAFNICGDETPSFNDVLNVLSELVGKGVRTVDVTSEFYAKELPERAGEILGGRSIDAINSNAKIKSVVSDFKQTVFLKEGIKRTYQAYIDGNYQHGIDWKFEGETDRIIKKWCDRNSIDVSSMNLGFVDYLGNARSKDRMEYYVHLHWNRADIRCGRFAIHALRRLKHLFS